MALQERKYRFEVGRGLEYVLTDYKMGKIGRDYLVQNFKNNEFGKGILEASAAIKSVLLGDQGSSYNVAGQDMGIKLYYAVTYLIILFIFFILPFLILLTKKKNKKDRFFDAAIAAIILFGGSGRRGGGGLGGGFGGFSGGSFGGGGAGGSF